MSYLMNFSARGLQFKFFVVALFIALVGCGTANVDFYDEEATSNGVSAEPESNANSGNEGTPESQDEASPVDVSDTDDGDEANERPDSELDESGDIDHEGDGSSDMGSTDQPVDEDSQSHSDTEDEQETTESENDSTNSADCEIVLSAEVRDESGPCTVCLSGDYITVVGVVENSCLATMTYRSEKSCVVSNFDVYNTVAGSSAVYPMTCPDEVLLESLAPGDSLTQTRPAGRLSIGSYELTVQFEDENRTSRIVSFSVQ